MVGKHFAGEFEGLYGIASANAAIDRRPHKTASRLGEWSSLGLLGTRNELDFYSKFVGRTCLGVRVYVISTELEQLPSLLRGTQSYMSSCFPINALGGNVIPQGLLAWREVYWKTPTEALSLRLDPASRETLMLLQTKLKSKT